MDTSDKYKGTYRSAINRCKKVLTAAGFPWSVTTGRYSPYNNQQKTSFGVRVQRVGCSNTVSLHVYDDLMLDNEEKRNTRRLILALATQTLREAGIPIQDNTFIDCSVDTY